MEGFRFDKKSGTMVPISEIMAESARRDTSTVREIPQPPTRLPVFKQEKRVEKKSPAPDASVGQVIRMRRTDSITPIQLVNEKGVPEAYLDSETMGVLMFREVQDCDVCQVVDERSGTVLAYISGYALQINFNMGELNTMERIEQCLQGLMKLFRHKIMTQQLGSERKGK